MVARWLTVLVVILTGISGRGTSAPATPTAQQWYATLSPKDLATGTFMHRVLIVTGLKDGHLQTLELSSDTFSENSFLDLIEGRETELCSLLNQRSDTLQDYHPPGDKLEQMFAAAFRFTPTDTIIYAPPDSEHWSIYRREAGLGVKKEFMVKGPDETTADAIKKWIIAKLGYSGVLMAQDGNYLLAAMYRELPEGGTAMLVLNSDNAFRIKKSQEAGSALLRRLDCHHNMCVFEILIPTINRYPIGTKLLF